METTWHTSQPHPWECPKPCFCVMAKLKEEALEFAESYKGNYSFLWDLFVYLMCSTPLQLENSVKQPELFSMAAEACTEDVASQ